MNPVRLLALFALCVPIPPAFGSAGDNATLPERLFPGLDQILRDTMNQSPGVVLRNLDLEIAHGDEMQAKSGQYPAVGGYLSYQWARESREGIANPYNAGLLNYAFSVSQPIWRWNSLRNNARMGEIRRKMAERQYEDGYRLLAQQIRGSYLDLIVRKAAADQAKFSQKLADSALQLMQDRLAKGGVSGGEVFNADMAAQQARLTTDRTDEDLHQALISFRRLIGQTTFDIGQVPDDIPRIYGGEDVPSRLLGDFLSQKEPENNDILILRQQLQTESLFLEIQRKRLYPMFTATAGFIQSRQQYSITAGSPLYKVADRYVGVSVNWSVFDGLATRAAIMGSRARQRQDEIRYKQAAENLPEDAQHAAKLTDLALRQMRINDRLFEDRGTYLQAREQDFKQGAASETDLNAVRASFIQTKITAYSYRAAYLQQLGDFLGFIMQDPVVQQVKVKRP